MTHTTHATAGTATAPTLAEIEATTQQAIAEARQALREKRLPLMEAIRLLEQGSAIQSAVESADAPAAAELYEVLAEKLEALQDAHGLLSISTMAAIRGRKKSEKNFQKSIDVVPESNYNSLNR